MTRRLCLAALLLIPISLGGCGWIYNVWGAYPPRVVSTENSGEDFTLSHGQQMYVRLPFKGETGFEWVLREPDVAAVKAEGAPAQSKEDGLEVWTFTPVRDGQQTVRLEYRRSDDYLTAPVQAVSYNVTVD